MGRKFKGLKPLKTAFCFLTTLPLKGETGTKASDFQNALPFFPWVGAFLGAGLFVLHYLLSGRISLSFEAVFLLLFWAIITGGLHLDGLADTADGCFSSRSQDRILEIMKDSRIGTMGVLALFFVLGFKFLALYEVCEKSLGAALFFSPLFGRFAILAVMYHLSYARPEAGLGSLFSGKKYSYKKGVLIAGLLLIFFTGIRGVFLFFIPVFLLSGYMVFLKRKIRGYTGDTLGAACELTETLMLVCGAVLF